MEEENYMIKEKEYLNCSECPKCRPQPGLKNGVKWGICHGSGNIVYLEPRKSKRANRQGYIYHPISGCGMYEKSETGKEKL
nr:hypothetical protein [uncultured Anaerobutyricum sp.]DAQ23941.1 MAG TPA: hypothetical protein [Caudoviricetes sp.]